MNGIRDELHILLEPFGNGEVSLPKVLRIELDERGASIPLPLESAPHEESIHEALNCRLVKLHATSVTTTWTRCLALASQLPSIVPKSEVGKALRAHNWRVDFLHGS
jgi:hypothetical protein